MVWMTSFVAAFILVYLLMPIFIRLMERYKILDSSGGRKIHKGYTAHMGGIVIFIAFAISLTASIFQLVEHLELFHFITFIALLALVVILGVRDDMNSLSPRTKLICEVAVGFLLCALGIRLHSFFGLFGVETLPVWLSYVITIAFIIVCCNAYNLIDGIDGQAGTQAIVTFIFLSIFIMPIILSNENFIASKSFFANPTFWLTCYISIIGAIIGFLIFNWQPAKIFMGDTGSLFIGTLIAISIIMSMNYNGETTGSTLNCSFKSNLLVFPMFFFLPFADTLRVFISRIRRGKSPFDADKTHIHHFFIRLGYSHQKTTLTTLSISIIIALISAVVALWLEDIYYILYIIAMWFIFVFSLKLFMKRAMKKAKANKAI